MARSSGAGRSTHMSTRRLVLALVAVGVVALEVAVVVLVASYLGWWTLLLMLLTSGVGAYLVKREWRKSWRALQQALAVGASARRELGDAAVILAGGLLVLVPGFVTDVLGILAVLGPTRPVVRRLVTAVAGSRLDRLDGAVPGAFPAGARPADDGHDAPAGSVVEGRVVDRPPDD